MQEQNSFHFCSEENELQQIRELKLSLVCLYLEIQNPKMLNIFQLQMNFVCIFRTYYFSFSSISLKSMT